MPAIFSTNRLTLPALALIPLLWLGCKSFEERVRPVVETPSERDSATVYVTGRVSYTEAGARPMNASVWRVDSDDYPDSLRLFVRVLDPEGNFISDLAPPYLPSDVDVDDVWRALSEEIGRGGRRYPVPDFDVREFSDKDGIPYQISLALDYSGSMGQNIEWLERAATTFIDLKLPQDRIGIVTFSDEARIAVKPATSIPELKSQYRQATAGGSSGRYTALYQAGSVGIQQFSGDEEAGPRVLILFTDGEDNASLLNSAELYQELKEEDVTVFAVGFGAVNRTVLETLAEGTGGKYYQTNDPVELEAIFRDIYLSLRNYYLVTYKPPRVDGRHLVDLDVVPPTGQELLAEAAYSTFGIGPEPIVGTELTIDTVYFEYNRAELQERSFSTIDAVASLMQERETMMVEVQGHTDATGTEEYNDSLSLARAEVVVDALADRGISRTRLRARAFGESFPVAPNADEEGRRQNRRTVFRVLRW